MIMQCIDNEVKTEDKDKEGDSDSIGTARPSQKQVTRVMASIKEQFLSLKIG